MSLEFRTTLQAVDVAIDCHHSRFYPAICHSLAAALLPALLRTRIQSDPCIRFTSPRASTVQEAKSARAGLGIETRGQAAARMNRRTSGEGPRARDRPWGASGWGQGRRIEPPTGSADRAAAAAAKVRSRTSLLGPSPAPAHTRGRCRAPRAAATPSVAGPTCLSGPPPSPAARTRETIGSCAPLDAATGPPPSRHRHDGRPGDSLSQGTDRPAMAG